MAKKYHEAEPDAPEVTEPEASPVAESLPEAAQTEANIIGKLWADHRQRLADYETKVLADLDQKRKLIEGQIAAAITAAEQRLSDLKGLTEAVHAEYTDILAKKSAL